MKTQTDQEFTVSGNLPGTKIQMGFDPGATGHLMTMMSKQLYSDPIMAVIREYSTNAFDAHIEAGNHAPIEVELPGALRQTFVVRDYGVGLGMHDLKHIYSQYGASTKRDSNDQVGSFGLGCKAAFAYVNQFTLTSVKDGIESQIAVSREADGTGTLTVVFERQTDKHDGTEVTVPVARHDIHTFEYKAREFYGHWLPGTVLVNSSPPAQHTGIRITDTIKVVSGGGPDLIVMGNVPYPSPHKIADVGYDNRIVARVAIGDVTIPGQRESLLDSPQTQETLKRLQRAYRANAASAVQAFADKAPDIREAIRVIEKWHGILTNGSHHYGSTPFDSYTYKGKTLPTRFNHGTQPTAGQPTPSDAMWMVRRYYNRLDNADRTVSIGTSEVIDAWLVHGFDEASWTATKRKKLAKFFADKGLQFPQKVILMAAAPTADEKQWFDAGSIVDWPTIKAIKLPQAVRPISTSNRLPGSYDFWAPDGLKTGVASDDIDAKLPLLYLVGNKYEARALKPLLDVFAPKGYSLVFFGSNREDKFRRTFPKEAQCVGDFIRKHADSWVKTLTNDQRLAYTVRHQSYAWQDLAKLDASKIHDPDLKEAIRVSKLVLSGVANKVVEQSNALINAGFRTAAHGIDVPMPKGFKSSSYPMLRGGFGRPTGCSEDHFYAYLNTAYAWKKAGINS